jgi:transcriptional regulator with XRE-family HTH domain
MSTQMRDSETFSTAVRALRDSLGETQASMAQLLGVSLRTYDRWEAGDASPRGNILVKLLDLCPDDHARSLFRVPASPHPPETSRTWPAPSRLRRSSAADRLRMRLRNSCLEAIRIIYEAAVLGSAAADEKLRTYADELNRNAAILAKEPVKHHQQAID